MPMRFRRVAAVTVSLVLACSTDSPQEPAAPEAPDPPSDARTAVAAVIVTPAWPGLAVGQSQQLNAIVINQWGEVLSDRAVEWRSDSDEIVSVSGLGFVRVMAVGQAFVIATVDERSGFLNLSTLPTALTPVQSMLDQLADFITGALSANLSSLSGTPATFEQINAKIEMLRRPPLESEIRDGGHYESGSAVSLDGRTLEIGTVFPLDTMREGAVTTVGIAEAAVSLLEEFLGISFPTNSIRIWYGFRVGNAGGGGSLFMEDRGTYVTRPPGTQMEYDAVIGHELAHSYISNEALTQFLEVYVYNRLLGHTADLTTWTFTRGWRPGTDGNAGVHALLDIYQLIGREAMVNAYRRIYPLQPRYGQPVSPAVQQAFIANAPAAVQMLVAAHAARIGG